MNRRYRKTMIIGNWKMNMTLAETKSYMAELRALAAKAKWCEIALCVPFTHISAAKKAAKGSRIDIGAQNCHAQPSGAFTGEVSCQMLTELGVEYVILGHSERRTLFGETDSQINGKVLAALEAGLRPILCVGESLEIREQGATLEHVACQIKAGLHGVPAESIRRVVIAYEPIWAIGTGRTATEAQAGEVSEDIRRVLRQLYGARSARSVSILYGGSMNDKNAAALMQQPDVDGGLVGGASLDTGRMSAIIEAANQ